jgi:tetratricopeptide (TPR) repeat protein
MTKDNEKAIKRAAISELERLSLFLDTELSVTASMPIEEVEEDLRQMGIDPSRPLFAGTRYPVFAEARDRAGRRARTRGRDALEIQAPAYVYVCDDPLGQECSDDVKFLILKIRHLTRQERYEEALVLARQATELAPDYWRAGVSLGSLLALFGQVAEGDEIFERVVKDSANNPKAVAHGLHARAWVKEVKFELAPSGEALQEVSRWYEQALNLDSSRANTRACLYICRVKEGGGDYGQGILKDSLLHEGFFDALSFELKERGVSALSVLQVLPSWLRRLIHPGQQDFAGVYGY